MLLEQVSTYRNLITLKDGARVLVRPLTSDDAERLVEMFAPVAPEDARFLRDPVSDAETVRRWAAQVDYARVLPLVALVGERIVGDATLHFRTGPARHVGEVRIFLAKDFRRRGNVGFELQCTFEDFFMFPDGETTDTALLTLRLAPREEEF